jgi:hypothetical protein
VKLQDLRHLVTRLKAPATMEYCNHLLHALSKRQHVDGLFQTLDVSGALFSCLHMFLHIRLPDFERGKRDGNRPTFTESKGIASLAQ